MKKILRFVKGRCIKDLQDIHDNSFRQFIISDGINKDAKVTYEQLVTMTFKTVCKLVEDRHLYIANMVVTEVDEKRSRKKRTKSFDDNKPKITNAKISLKDVYAKSTGNRT